MKAKLSLPILVLALGLYACQNEQNGTNTNENEGAGTADVQSFKDEVKGALANIDNEIQSLGKDTTDLTENTRSGVMDGLAEVRKERNDLNELQNNIAADATTEDLDEAREKLHDEYNEAHAAIANVRLEAADTKEEFRTELNDEINALDTEIESMEKPAENVTAEARKDYDDRVIELKNERDALKNSLTRLDSATEETWMDVKRDLIKEWRDVRKAFFAIDIPGVETSADGETSDRSGT